MTKSQNTKNEQQKDLCITVEKQVWESTLHRSMVLQAENTKLKELLEECRHIIGIEKDFATCHFEEYTFVELLTKIDEVLK